MKFVDSRTGIEAIDRAECLELLAGEVIGRLAVSDHGAPMVFPVNYALDGESIVFRTAPGTKVDVQGLTPACFEIDSFDREKRTGWSVIAVGHLEEVSQRDTAAIEHLRTLPVDPWADGPKDIWMRLHATRVTGRRVSR